MSELDIEQRKTTPINPFQVFIIFGILVGIFTYLFVFDLIPPGRLFRFPLVVVVPLIILIVASFLTWAFVKYDERTKKKPKKERRKRTRKEVLLKILLPYIAGCLILFLIVFRIYTSISNASYNRYLTSARQNFIVELVDDVPIKQVESTLVTLERGMVSARKLIGVDTQSAHKVYIFSNVESMQGKKGLDPNVGGFMFMENGQASICLPAELAMNPMTENDMTTTPKHEAIHVVFADILGEDIWALPKWFIEGVAIYGEFRGNEARLNRLCVRFSLWRKMVKVTPKQILLSSNLQPIDYINDSFYYTSYELTRYIMRNYGEDSLILILELLRDGSDLDTAFFEVYGINPEKAYENWINEFF